MGGGKLIVITGPMFAGKTTRLLREMKKASKKSVVNTWWKNFRAWR